MMNEPKCQIGRIQTTLSGFCFDPMLGDVIPLYGITAAELHVKIMNAVSDHLYHMERADLAERFVEMCGTCGIEQAIISTMERY